MPVSLRRGARGQRIGEQRRAAHHRAVLPHVSVDETLPLRVSSSSREVERTAADSTRSSCLESSRLGEASRFPRTSLARSRMIHGGKSVALSDGVTGGGALALEDAHIAHSFTEIFELSHVRS